MSATVLTSCGTVATEKTISSETIPTVQTNVNTDYDMTSKLAGNAQNSNVNAILGGGSIGIDSSMSPEKTNGNTVTLSGDKKIEGPVSYEVYSASAYKESFGKKAMVLFFYSQTPSSKASDELLNAQSRMLKGGVTIYKVDFEGAADLKKQFGITMDNTFVGIAKNGVETLKTAGVNSIDDVQRIIQSAL